MFFLSKSSKVVRISNTKYWEAKDYEKKFTETQFQAVMNSNLVEEWTVRVLKRFRFLRFIVEIPNHECVAVQDAQVSRFMHCNWDQKITQKLVKTRQNFVRHLLIKIKTFLMKEIKSKLNQS